MVFTHKTCGHLKQILEVKKAAEYQCEECIKTGDTWVHLRTCQDCGTTLCCDSSPNKHARKHAKRHEHHVINSAEPNEFWLYCYKDDITMQY